MLALAGIFCLCISVFTYYKAKSTIRFTKGLQMTWQEDFPNTMKAKVASPRSMRPGIWFGTLPKTAEAEKLETKLKNLSIERTVEFIKKYPVPSDIFKISPVVQL